MVEIRRERTAEQEIVVLGGDLTITDMSSVKSELQHALQNASAVLVRLEQVRELDVAFLQLLCSAHRTAADQNKSFRIGGEIEPFRTRLKKAGFQRHIGCRENSKYPCLWLCEQGGA